MYLDSIAAIDFHFALVIFPDDTELNNSFGNLTKLIGKIRGTSTVTTERTFFNSGRFSKSVLLSRVEIISSLAYWIERLV